MARTALPESTLRRPALAALALFALAPAGEAQTVGLSSTRSLLVYETGENPAHPAEPNDELGRSVAVCDFDGDGVDDLAIGMPGDNQIVPEIADVGQVMIRWGTRSGEALDAVNPKWIWQGGVGSVQDPEPGDRFGASLAAGYFDNDGQCDLAVGSPSEELSGFVNVGAVIVHYGDTNRSDALTAFRQLFHPGTPGVPGNISPGVYLGEVLAAADFDGDQFDDLAIGLPHQFAGDSLQAGRVYVLYGSPTGISTAGVQDWSCATPNLCFHSPSENFHFGEALAAADFDADGYAGLAVGERETSAAGGGLLFVLQGSLGGLTTTGVQTFGQGFGGIGGFHEAGDYFATALAVGSFNGDVFPDLVVGVPGEDLPDSGPGPFEVDAGSVVVLHGSANGITTAGYHYWTASSTGMPGFPESGDFFGRAVGAGDFDHDGYDEAVIGVPFENNYGGGQEGDVLVLPGSAAGPTSVGAERFNLQTPGILGDMNAGDRLGWCLATGDFDDDGHDDLAAGMPYDGTSGSVLVLYGALFADDFETGSPVRWSATEP